jgi:hypothetical protein
MLRRVAFVRIDVSEELVASIIGVTRIGELGTTLILTNNGRTLRKNTEFTDSCRPDDGSANFFRNIGPYKSHTA